MYMYILSDTEPLRSAHKRYNNNQPVVGEVSNETRRTYVNRYNDYHSGNDENQIMKMTIYMRDMIDRYIGARECIKSHQSPLFRYYFSWIIQFYDQLMVHLVQINHVNILESQSLEFCDTHVNIHVYMPYRFGYVPVVETDMVFIYQFSSLWPTRYFLLRFVLYIYIYIYIHIYIYIYMCVCVCVSVINEIIIHIWYEIGSHKTYIFHRIISFSSRIEAIFHVENNQSLW